MSPSRSHRSTLPELRATLSKGPLPKLFVFDLDYTIWSAYIDCTSGPPYKLHGPSKIIDRHGSPVKLYPQALSILKALAEHDCSFGVASRTETPEWAEQVLRLFFQDFDEKFTAGAEIYPSSKREHFANFRERNRVEYEEMVFFDDEHRNIRDVSGLGVVCQYIKDGVTEKDIVEAIEKWRSS